MKVPKVIVDATSEPLTLAEARLQCRVDPIDDLDSDGNGTHPDDDLIEMLITAAREYCEQFLGVSLVRGYVLRRLFERYRLQNGKSLSWR